MIPFSHIRRIRASFLAQALTLLPVAVFSQEIDPTWTIFEWENHYELQGDWFSDPDGDGLANYIEFGYGLNPLVKDALGSNETTPRVTRAPNGSITVQLWQPRFPNIVGLGDGAYGRHWFWIELQTSTDLQDWETIAEKPGMNGGFYPTKGGIEISETEEPLRMLIDIQDSRGSSSRAKYYRLRYSIIS